MELDLPRRVGVFLGITDPEALAVLGAVLRKDDHVVLNKILDTLSVRQVDRDSTASGTELGAPPDVHIKAPVELSQTEATIHDESIPVHFAPSTWASDRQQRPVDGSINVGDLDEVSVLGSSIGAIQLDAQQIVYKSILEHVVNVARQRALSGVFETNGGPIQGPLMTEALAPGVLQESFDTTTKDGRDRLGAAGEFYMFEYLKNLGLPDFGFENWKSSHRNKVRIHKEYRSMQEYFRDAAIADIEYEDHSGRLTQFLIQHGLLERDLWPNGGPVYLFEIKTTARSDWQTTFYMSKTQRDHVRIFILPSQDCSQILRLETCPWRMIGLDRTSISSAVSLIWAKAMRLAYISMSILKRRVEMESWISGSLATSGM